MCKLWKWSAILAINLRWNPCSQISIKLGFRKFGWQSWRSQSNSCGISYTSNINLIVASHYIFWCHKIHFSFFIKVANKPKANLEMKGEDYQYSSKNVILWWYNAQSCHGHSFKITDFTYHSSQNSIIQILILQLTNSFPISFYAHYSSSNFLIIIHQSEMVHPNIMRPINGLRER